MVLGKPGLWPALVLNTVLRKPCRQLPLAEVREPDISEVPEDPDEAEAALLVLVVDDGKTKVTPALALLVPLVP